MTMTNEFWLACRSAKDQASRAQIAGLVHATAFGILGGAIAISVGLRTGADFVPFGYAFVLALLAIGTGRRNRTAAVLLLAAAFTVEGGVWWRTGSLLALATMFVFCPFYAFGVRAA